MLKSIGFGLIIAGFIIMAHAGLSMWQFRQYVRMHEDESIHAPTDITTEVLISIAVCAAGVLLRFQSLKPILAYPDAAQKTYDSLSTREEFQIYNHRGRAITRLRELAESQVQGESKSKQ